MELKISKYPVDYNEAVAEMEVRVQAIRAGEKDELVWLLEHPPLYTAGTSAKDEDLIDTMGFPVYKTGRGGQYTYHGPGQRIAYILLDLKKRNPDVRLFVKQLEECIILTLAEFGIKGEIKEGRVGVWVKGVADKKLEVRESLLPSYSNKYKEYKIAALGIRIRQWVTYHGIAVNINPDLSHYNGIIPCGITEYGVTSFRELGVIVTDDKFDEIFIKSFNKIF